MCSNRGEHRLSVLGLLQETTMAFGISLLMPYDGHRIKTSLDNLLTDSANCFKSQLFF